MCAGQIRSRQTGPAVLTSTEIQKRPAEDEALAAGGGGVFSCPFLTKMLNTLSTLKSLKGGPHGLASPSPRSHPQLCLPRGPPQPDSGVKSQNKTHRVHPGKHWGGSPRVECAFELHGRGTDSLPTAHLIRHTHSPLPPSPPHLL